MALAIAAYITAEGHRLGIGRTSDPGSGFILFWAGLGMAALSAALMIQSLGRRGDTASIGAAFQTGRWGKVLYVTALLIAYTALLDVLGFVIGTFLLLIVLFKTVEPQSWRVALIGSALATFSAWALFVAWLGTQLPAGLLGIG